MLESPQYRNTIDHLLSDIAENDQSFKRQLVAIYSGYMRDIPLDFNRLIDQKNWEGLVQLHHKHKTTCHILALQELSETFNQVRDIVAEKLTNKEDLLVGCTKRVSTICHDTLIQLEEID